MAEHANSSRWEKIGFIQHRKYLKRLHPSVILEIKFVQTILKQIDNLTSFVRSRLKKGKESFEKEKPEETQTRKEIKQNEAKEKLPEASSFDL